MDIIFIGLGWGFFVLTAGLVAFSDTLLGE